MLILTELQDSLFIKSRYINQVIVSNTNIIEVKHNYIKVKQKHL